MSINVPNFYTVIIGSELLNGRRKDAHFSFINIELLKRGWEQKANFVIVDKPEFIEDVFSLIKKDTNSVLFCFGGIGSTPDDCTRVCAANSFTNGKIQYHKKAKEIIEKQFGQDAYPHRIEMSNLPLNAKLLDNPINNVPGFYLEKRYFFVPGFPNMAHPMILQALDNYYPKSKLKQRLTLTAHCSENELIDTMKQIPNNIELSSLPSMIDNRKKVVISLASYDKEETTFYFEMFLTYLKNNKISWS